MNTWSRLLNKSHFLASVTPFKQPAYRIYRQGYFRNLSTTHKMSNSESMAPVEKRAMSPSDDVHSLDSKRPRLNDALDASTSSVQDSNLPNEPSTPNDAPADADGEATSSTNAPNALRPKKRSHRDFEPKNKQRGWGRRSRNEEDAAKDPEQNAEGEDGPKALRYPKRQCSLLLGFCGSGYSGMQMYVRILSPCYRSLKFKS